MKIQLSAETARKLNELAASSGRTPDEIAEDALAGYLGELVTIRKRLDSRYDDLKSRRVKAIDGEDAFRKLREKGDQRRLGE